MIQDRPVRASARGKVILAGEHAVLYGAPVVAVGLDRGVRATASPATTPDTREMRLATTSPGPFAGAATRVRADGPEDLARAFAALLEASGVRAPIFVDVESDLPPGAGLGSSAAIGVAVARALDPRAPDAEVLRWTMAWERVFHGEASGVDAHVAATGGAVLFERDSPAGARTRRVTIPRALHICVGHSGASASTRAMVRRVATLRTTAPAATARVLDAIGQIARRMADALGVGDLATVGALMDANHRRLATLGLTTPRLDDLASLARRAGACGAKLTGSGGGGAVVALAPDGSTALSILRGWRRASYEGFCTALRADVRPSRIDP